MSLRSAHKKSVAAAFHPEVLEHRRQIIADYPDFKTRAGALVVHSLVSRNPARAAHKLGLEILPRPDLVHLGSGAKVSTFTNGKDDKVTKVNRLSLFWAPEKRLQEASKTNKTHLLVGQVLGQFIINQQSAQSSHPFFREADALMTWQPRVEGDTTSVFRLATAYATAKAIQGMEDKYPGYSDQLAEFCDRSLWMAESMDLLPDTYIGSNVPYDPDSGHIKLVDHGFLKPHQPQWGLTLDNLKTIQSLTPSIR